MTLNRREFLKKSSAALAMLPVSGFLKQEKETDQMPRVLILGDSISIGYTPFVKSMLEKEAEVVRPDENCQGTTHGLAKIRDWLGDTRWDVIHFNFGLHDLKHVDPVTGKNSTNPADPQQADVRQYYKNLKEITQILKKTGARLVFATTTPFPDNPDGPLRKASDTTNYNKAALKIMRKNKVAVNDLYSFVLPRMEALQIPKNVHFTKAGSEALASQVAESIRKALK